MPIPFTKGSSHPAVDPVVKLTDAAVAIGVSLCTLKRLDERERFDF